MFSHQKIEFIRKTVFLKLPTYLGINDPGQSKSHVGVCGRGKPLVAMEVIAPVHLETNS
jgi:hypothetical protein